MILEKRRNDFKTEGEYISKILNRNIYEEFYNQMKKELKNLVINLSEGNENSFDQVTATFPGCDDLNEKLDIAAENCTNKTPSDTIRCQSIAIQVSASFEKLLFTIDKCHSEICKKVYPKEREKAEEFSNFCVEMINLFFKRIQMKKESDRSRSLPQFVALFLNDISYGLAFITARNLNYTGNNMYSSHDKKIITNDKSYNHVQIQRLRLKVYKSFVNDQKKEIDLFLGIEEVDQISKLEKAFKRVSMFLTRLGNVLKPIMLPSDLLNLKLILLNHIQGLGWNFIKNLSDIDEDELGPLKKYCNDLINLDSKIIPDLDQLGVIKNLLKYSKKLEIVAKILDQSLIEIINCYHRDEYANSGFRDEELCELVEAIFAASSLRNEFIKELNLTGNDEGYF